MNTTYIVGKTIIYYKSTRIRTIVGFDGKDAFVDQIDTKIPEMYPITMGCALLNGFMNNKILYLTLDNGI